MKVPRFHFQTNKKCLAINEINILYLTVWLICVDLMLVSQNKDASTKKSAPFGADKMHRSKATNAKKFVALFDAEFFR